MAAEYQLNKKKIPLHEQLHYKDLQCKIKVDSWRCPIRPKHVISIIYEYWQLGEGNRAPTKGARKRKKYTSIPQASSAQCNSILQYSIKLQIFENEMLENI
jgi:hypothetical protein